METLKVKLKTLEQLIEEFGFEEYEDNYYFLYKGNQWSINRSMIEMLGKIVELIPGKHGDYTHKSIDHDNIRYNGWYFHELWFDYGNFIEEDDFKI